MWKPVQIPSLLHSWVPDTYRLALRWLSICFPTFNQFLWDLLLSDVWSHKMTAFLDLLRKCHFLHQAQWSGFPLLSNQITTTFLDGIFMDAWINRDLINNSAVARALFITYSAVARARPSCLFYCPLKGHLGQAWKTFLNPPWLFSARISSEEPSDLRCMMLVIPFQTSVGLLVTKLIRKIGCHKKKKQNLLRTAT